jgi:hypothetical protein
MPIQVQAKDLTPPPSPTPIKVASVSKAGAVKGMIQRDAQGWPWWQGYRKDRRILGFEAPPGKNVMLTTNKRGPRKKKKDDD